MSQQKPLGPVTQTSRGFEIIKFKDRNDTECSLQVSSVADYSKPGISAVWIGPEDAEPKVMWKNAASLGVKTEKTEGWVPFPIPTDVLLTTRAHLHREHVQALIMHLQSWLDNDTFEPK